MVSLFHSSNWLLTLGLNASHVLFYLGVGIGNPTVLTPYPYIVDQDKAAHIKWFYNPAMADWFVSHHHNNCVDTLELDTREDFNTLSATSLRWFRVRVAWCVQNVVKGPTCWMLLLTLHVCLKYRGMDKLFPIDGLVQLMWLLAVWGCVVCFVAR